MQAWLSFFAADSARMPVQTVLLTYNRLCTNAGLTVLLCSRHGTNAGPNSLADVVHVCVLWPAELGCSKGLSSVSSQSFSLVKRFWRYDSRYSLRSATAAIPIGPSRPRSLPGNFPGREPLASLYIPCSAGTSGDVISLENEPIITLNGVSVYSRSSKASIVQKTKPSQ